MKCPQCGAKAPDDAWNCPACRINLYWATQHYEQLVKRGAGNGLATTPRTPSFLIRAHHDAMAERAERGGAVEHKVRRIARLVMTKGAT